MSNRYLGSDGRIYDLIRQWSLVRGEETHDHPSALPITTTNRLHTRDGQPVSRVNGQLTIASTGVTLEPLQND